MFELERRSRVALVTGAHGAVGRYVSRLLASDGWYVAGLGHGGWKGTSAADWGIGAWCEGDVSPVELARLCLRPDLIVHCAGSGAVGASMHEPYSDFSRTVTTTAVILEFIRVNCPEAVLVYPSSAAVYGIAERLPIAEDSALHPTSPYGVHKRCAEDLVVGHARLFGIRAAVVRLFSVYGEHFRKQLLWDACHRICDNETTFSGTGSETRDFLHVSDAARLLVASARHASAACPIANGGSGISVSIERVLTELFELLGRSSKPSFDGKQRSGDPRDYQADITMATGWGWSPKINLSEGLRGYVDWYLRERN